MIYFKVWTQLLVDYDDNNDHLATNLSQNIINPNLLKKFFDFISNRISKILENLVFVRVYYNYRLFSDNLKSFSQGIDLIL